MISLIEAVLGSKVGRVVAEILFALIAIAALVLHFEHKGAAEELGKLQKSSAELVQKITKQHTADTTQYEMAAAVNQETTSAVLAANVTLQSQLADSVRQFDAYRRQHPAVASASSASGSTVAGECGSEDCGAIVERLAVRGNELAGSLGGVDADLQSCQRDRDALTGQPK